MVRDTRLSIHKTINRKLPRLPFFDIKNAILGKNYELSLVFIGDKRAQTLNKRYRKKNYIPDVLTFPYSDTQGEIFINPLQAHKNAKGFDMNEKKFITYLFIHALLHLKGLRHSSTMDTVELAYLRRFYH